MSLTIDDKIDNLWKKSRGVVDIEKEAAYYDVAQKPFVENILNKDIFSKEVPDEIPGQLRNVSGFGPISENSVIGLDDKFDISFNVPPGGVPSSIPNNEISNVIGYPGYKLSSIGYPHLTYYHRIPLIEHPTSNKTKPLQLVKTTWYIPDPTNPELSALRYSINFKKGGLRHYEQRFYAHTTNPNPDEIKEGFSPHLMVFDNKSGYVLLYGDDEAFNWKITSARTGRTGPLLMSFIRYEGPLGAVEHGAGLDASFNNVDISNNLNVANITVTESASLPKNTLIQPIWYNLAGSNEPDNPFFNKEYAQTQSYNAICVDPSENLITDQDWITIARVGENISGYQDGRAHALFTISHPQSGRHETITFIASFKFADGIAINVLQHDWYSVPNFKALRIMYESTYDGAILQLKFTSIAFKPIAKHPRNPLQIYIKNDHDYPGWEQNTFDVLGSKIQDGIEVFFAVPNNAPTSQNQSSPVLFTNEFLLDNLDWDPAGADANQITTNPARFTRQLDVVGRITTDSSIGATNNIVAGQSVIGSGGVFDDLTVNDDAEVGRFLTVNEDGFIQRLEATNFNATGSIRPFLAEISAQLVAPSGPYSGRKNIIGHATFEIIASSSNPVNKTSSRNQVIIGTILVTGSCKDGSSSYRDITGIINIIHSSWCGSTAPLISRVFFNGFAQTLTSTSLLNCRFFIESSAAIPYLLFKVKNNNKNDYTGVQTTGSGVPLPAQGTFHTYWNINRTFVIGAISPSR